ncbi:MAG: dihydrodipicolinate synthase family protein, partial [Anaerolineales bacterium]
MMAGELDLAGVFPPTPTSFDEKGNLALDRLADNLSRWSNWPLAGYVVGGSNGEFILLEDSERVAVVEAARRSIPDGQLLIAGSGAQSTRRTLALTESMAAVGADAVIVVTPSYYRRQMDVAAMVSHFETVADASPVPVVLYNV